MGQEGGVAYPQNLFQPFLVLYEGQPQGIVQAGQKKIGLEERELKPSVVAWNKRRFLKKGGREELWLHIACVYAIAAGKLHLGALFKQTVVAG